MSRSHMSPISVHSIPIQVTLTRSAHSLQMTQCLRTIEAQCVEFRILVQKAFLRGHGHDNAPIGQKDRLAQLKIPIAHRELPPLKGRERKVRPLDISESASRVGRLC